MPVLGDEVDDLTDLAFLVAEFGERPRDGLVDDLHGTTADEFLELHQGEVGFDAGGVAVHHETDSSGGGEHRGLGVTVAVLLADRDHLFPFPSGHRVEIRVGWHHGRGFVGGEMLAHHLLVGLGVASIAVVGPDDPGQLRGATVGGRGHDGCDGGRGGTSPVSVVALAHGHQQRPEVGVPDPELPEIASGLTN